MKIGQIIVFLFFATLIISCSRDEDSKIIQDNEPLVTSVKRGFLLPELLIRNPTEINFMISYDNQKRITKKTGGFIPINGATGFNASFTNQVYTSLIYTNNKVTVEDFSSSPDFTIPKKSKYFTLDSQNHIIEKEIPNSSFYRYEKQEFVYKSNILDEIKTTLPNIPFDPTDPNDYVETYSEKFFYDGKGNLIKTEYFEERNGVKTENKIIRYFENYDQSSNPFKRFTLLDEYFYRSLSKNNFRNYREVRSLYGNTSTSQQDWTFNYDANGNIIID